MVTSSAAIDQPVPPAVLPAALGTIGALGTPVTGIPIIPEDQYLFDYLNPVPSPTGPPILTGNHTFMHLPSDPDLGIRPKSSPGLTNWIFAARPPMRSQAKRCCRSSR